MTVKCHINVLGGDGYSRVLTFQVVPRVGEYLGFSLDGKRDERGVLVMDRYRVKHVMHTAENDQMGPIVLIDVETEQDANRT
ncbi:conserved hypothetical protein [Mesorhizobium sp. ORS 3324]|nr:conserved hypothetical protein [Mesorhizobium sp. ORS 3324]